MRRQIAAALARARPLSLAYKLQVSEAEADGQRLACLLAGLLAGFAAGQCRGNAMRTRARLGSRS